MTEDIIDRDLIEAIAAQLELREPNRVALESIAYAVTRHYQIERRDPPFEGVIDSATAMGKTYIVAASIDYYASLGTRNFAVVTPGRTILEKTVGNFTPGHPKSLLSGMVTRPVVITSENFATPEMRAAMEDASKVKLFIFTVQALLRPQANESKKTHKFQEGLGKAFYSHLVELDDLVVFADEHHTYYGAAFSRAVRDLEPYALIGLTATPHSRTPDGQIIYRYPLAAAIADKYVKTPVIVGRKDDRSDPLTKLLDGVRLLDFKTEAVQAYVRETAVAPVNPVMLVIAQTIDDANEYGRIIEDSTFAGGRYSGKVLVIHSDSPDEALAALEQVESESSPVRVIISVGMLKEGWDVKNVYVIASMRALVSEILTEQTLGRGLRLPFGKYTDIEILDTLEVLAHERYDELLRKKDVINEAFIDHRTQAVLRRDSSGSMIVTTESSAVSTPAAFSEPLATAPVGAPVLGSLESRVEQSRASATALQVQLVPRPGLTPLQIPRLKMSSIESHFSLADITDHRPYRELGVQVSADPDAELRRTKLTAQIVDGGDGLKRTVVMSAPAVDRVASTMPLLPLEGARAELARRVLGAPVVPARGGEAAALAPLLDAFIEGLGSKAAELLTAFMDRAAARFIGLVTEEHRRFVSKPTFDEVTDLVAFGPTRVGRAATSSDRTGGFSRSLGYVGWSRSMYDQVWFDSSTEREVANILDSAASVRFWVRMHRDDLPILWHGAGNFYNPDFIAVEADGKHWIIEAKMDKEVDSVDVRAKREAAVRWSNRVSPDPRVGVRWRYLLVSETDISEAKGSWEALKKLGGG